LSTPLELEKFVPIPDDQAKMQEEQLNQRLRKANRNGLLALIKRGEASLILQSLENLAGDELEIAVAYFERAIRAYPGDPLGYFYLGVVEDMKKPEKLSLNDSHTNSLAKYLLMPEDSTILEYDFPPLVVLGFLWSQEPNQELLLNNLRKKHPELESFDEFEVTTRIYNFARKARPNAVSLTYNEAVAHAVNENQRVAADLFKDIIQQVDTEDQEYRYSTIGSHLIQVREGKYENIEKLYIELSNIIESQPENVQAYLENLEICSFNIDDQLCNAELLDWEDLENKGREVFPYLPMIFCQRNIPLAIAYPNLCFSRKD
jgi:hypothetical protein